MAELVPFRALHYSAEEVSALANVVTQPYDKISAGMQARYYDLSPYNLVRIIRGRPSPEDTPQNSVYTRARGSLQDWIERRVLVSEAEPAIYPYHQEYDVPGQPRARKERRGFIALGRLEDYTARVVHRHEETLSGPKADRLELLKATRAHFGQIFMLYSDPEGVIEATLAASVRVKPWESVTDEYNTGHSVWRVTEPSTIEAVVTAMRDKKLVIADGHHRYETALAYRDYCRARGEHLERTEYVMMTFVRMETEGLTILPTHRVVHSLPGFDWVKFRAAALAVFGWDEVPERHLRQRLAEAGRERSAFGVYAGPGKTALLRLADGASLATSLPDITPSLRQLDVVILHRLILERCLGIDRQAVREEKNLHYVREFDDAIHEVDSKRAQVAFLMNPTPIEAVRDNALAGHVLPQKSTDFYPKLLSGLTIYWLDNPSGI